MRSLRLLTSLASLALALGLASPARADEKSERAAKQLQAELAAWSAINGSGAAIDACIAAYVGEYPAAKGTARIDAKVAKDGSVAAATAATALEGARNLRPCLEKVAKGWRLPAHGAAEPQPLSLTVPVYKGAKFALRRPGDKEPPPQAGGAQPAEEEAAFNLSPAAFTPNWNPGN